MNNNSDPRSKLTHAAAVPMLIVLVTWCIIVVRLEESNSPYFIAAFTAFVGFASSVGGKFFEWIMTGKSDAK